MLVRFRAALPVLVRVTTCDEVVMATGPFPKFRLVGERLAEGDADAEMVMVKVRFVVPPLLVALSVTVEVPAAVGVPEINPVAVLTVSPAGNPVAL